MIASQKTVKLAYKDFKFNIETYQSSAELVRTLNTRTAKSWGDTLSVREFHSSWEGVETPQQALDLCEKGWSAKVGEVQRLVREAQRRIQSKRLVQSQGVCGFAPIVPLALAGSPESMIDMKIVPKKTKTIDLYYDMTVGSFMSSERLLKIGMKVLEGVMSLEASGYRVRLSAVQNYSSGADSDLLVVRIKDETQPFNIERMCFPLFNPAFFRVIGFGWYERCPTSKYRSAYGRSLGYILDKEDLKTASEQLFGKNAIVIYASLLNDAFKKAEQEGRTTTEVVQDLLTSKA